MSRKAFGVAAIAVVLLVPVLVVSRSHRAGVGVETAPVKARAISVSTLASGTLVYEQQAQLSPEVIGRVTSVPVREGDRVRQGQIVLTIDDQVYRSSMAQQEAAVRLQGIDIAKRALAVEDARIKFERASDLVKRGFVSQVTFEDARVKFQAAQIDLRTSRESLRQAQATLHQASDQLGKTIIRAPMSGTVIAVNIKQGETAVPSTLGIAGSNFMTIADTGSLIAEVNVDEADIARVRVGQDVTIHASAYPGVAIGGRVRSLPLSPKRADGAALAGGAPAPRTYTVKVTVRPPDTLLLRPGMTCRAEIVTHGSGRPLTVPIQAVFSTNSEDADDQSRKPSAADQAESYLFVLQDGQARKRMVRVGEADDQYEEVLAGLKPAERVISGPYKVLRFLKDGDRVTPAAGRRE